MNHCFVVCDLNPEFANRMAHYVNKRRLSPYLMESFTDVNLLAEYARKRYIDVLLIDELLYTEPIEKLNIGRVFLLVSDRSILQEDGQSKLYKFLPIPELMNQVMCDYADHNKVAMSTNECGAVKIIGAFTPDESLRHSSFLLTLSLKMAEKKKVFYLNLKTTHGLRMILNKMSGLDISDVMYAIKNGKKKMEEWPSDAVNSYGNLNYILPALSMTDLHYVETEEWEILLESLKEEDYDYIFLDLDESIGACFEFLRACDLIYSPYEDTYLCRMAYSEFEDAMEKMGIHDIYKKMINITPPLLSVDGPSEDFFNDLKCNELGVYVDKVLAGNR